jgi:hypothetical protein
LKLKRALNEVFDKKYGKYTTKGWKNISIIYNHDEVEEEN